MKGKKKINLLFICNFNMMRSPTAELIFKNHENVSTKSAGIFPEAEVPVTEKLLEWADIVMVMENSQLAFLREHFPRHVEARRLFCLDIPDNFPFMSPTLIELLNRKVPVLLKQLE